MQHRTELIPSHFVARTSASSKFNAGSESRSEPHSSADIGTSINPCAVTTEEESTQGGGACLRRALSVDDWAYSLPGLAGMVDDGERGRKDTLARCCITVHD